MPRFYLAALLVAVPMFAQAQDLPRLDPEKMCRVKWTEGGVLNNGMYAYCLGNEQTAYDTLKGEWSQISSGVRITCLRKWGGADGAYGMLKYCSDNERKAERGNASSGFRW